MQPSYKRLTLTRGPPSPSQNPCFHPPPPSVQAYRSVDTAIALDIPPSTTDLYPTIKYSLFYAQQTLGAQASARVFHSFCSTRGDIQNQLSRLVEHVKIIHHLFLLCLFHPQQDVLSGLFVGQLKSRFSGATHEISIIRPFSKG